MKIPPHMNLSAAGRHLLSMVHSPIGNYIIPGLTSTLIGDGTALKGRVRMFDASRDQHDEIVPHSHRFDLLSIVLAGQVENSTWMPYHVGDVYVTESIEYCGGLGDYKQSGRGEPRMFHQSKSVYKAGETYWMQHDTIHSIKFSKGAIVLILEGPEVTKRTNILLPVVDGKTIDTFRVEPWMFERLGD